MRHTNQRNEKELDYDEFVWVDDFDEHMRLGRSAVEAAITATVISRRIFTPSPEFIRWETGANRRTVRYILKQAKARGVEADARLAADLAEWDEAHELSWTSQLMGRPHIEEDYLS